MSIPIFIIFMLIFIFGLAYIMARTLNKHAANLVLSKKASRGYGNYFSEQLKSGFFNSSYRATSSGLINDFFDADVILSDPKKLEAILPAILVDLESILSQHRNAKLAFTEKDSGPVGVISIAALLSLETNAPFLIVRPKCKILEMAIKGGELAKGDKVILIQDVITTGNQVVMAHDVIKQFGAKIVGVVSLFDREENRKKQFVDIKVSPKSLLTSSQYKQVNQRIN